MDQYTYDLLKASLTKVFKADKEGRFSDAVEELEGRIQTAAKAADIETIQYLQRLQIVELEREKLRIKCGGTIPCDIITADRFKPILCRYKANNNVLKILNSTLFLCISQYPNQAFYFDGIAESLYTNTTSITGVEFNGTIMLPNNHFFEVEAVQGSVNINNTSLAGRILVNNLDLKACLTNPTTVIVNKCFKEKSRIIGMKCEETKENLHYTPPNAKKTDLSVLTITAETGKIEIEYNPIKP